MSLQRIDLQVLNSKRPFLSTSLLFVDWIAIGLALFSAHLSTSWLVWWLLSLWIGYHLHRIALMSHDFSHYLVMPGTRGYDWMANIFCFYPMGVTCLGYRTWHLQHHRHLNTENDPEKLVKGGRLYQQPLSKLMVFSLFIADHLGFGVLEIGKLQWVIRPKSLADALGLVLFWAVVLTMAAHFQLLPIIGLFLFSLMTSFWAAYRLRAITEHVGTDSSHRFNAPFWLKYFFFPYNTDHHYEHHEWPSIPWFSLPYARAKIREPNIEALDTVLTTIATKPEIASAEMSTPNFEKVKSASISQNPEFSSDQ